MGIQSIFGIGGPEFLFILILAGIFLGPGRIAQVARWLGQTTVKLQNISKGFVGQLKAELDMADGADDIREMLKEMQDLRNEVNTLQSQISTTLNEATAETANSLNELAELTHSIRPPTFDIAEDEEPNQIAPPLLATVPNGQNGSNGTNVPLPPSGEGSKVDKSPAIPPPLPKVKTVEDDPE